MSKQKTLSPIQESVITNALSNPKYSLEPLPQNVEELNSTCINKVILGLFSRGYVKAKEGSNKYFLNANGIAFATKLRGEDPAPAPEGKTNKKRTVITLVSRKDGATLDELCKATGWLGKSVRGTISTLKKELNIESVKEGDERIFRLAK